MTDKFEKFLGIINETLEYNKPDDDKIILFEEKLSNEGLDAQDIKLCFKKLIEEKVILKKEMMYASKITSPTFPAEPTLVSTPDENYQKPVYLLEINRKKLKKLLTELPDSKGLPVEFLDNEPAIKCGDKKCPLPPFKNEHFFCRAIFEYPIGEAVDWSIIYEKITGYYKAYYGKPPATRENWRIVYDTMEALNNRVKEILGIDKLFNWKEKTIKRIR